MSLIFRSKLRTNEPQPNFTGSYKKKACRSMRPMVIRVLRPRCVTGYSSHRQHHSGHDTIQRESLLPSNEKKQHQGLGAWPECNGPARERPALRYYGPCIVKNWGWKSRTVTFFLSLEYVQWSTFVKQAYLNGHNSLVPSWNLIPDLVL